MNLKMNRFLVLVVLCIASASCVELENLCSSDSFDYNGVEVNAFYRVRQNITFESLSHYLIDHAVTCDQSEFINKTNYWEALKARNRYNRKFAELYTEDLNGNTAEEISDKALTIDIDGWIPLHEMKIVETKSKCLEIFERKAYSGRNVFSILKKLTKYNGYPIFDADSKPTSLEAIKILEKLFEKLKTSADAFALKSERPWDVFFHKNIILPREFHFLTEGSDRVGPDTKSMFTYDQFLPFNTKDHVDQNCVPVEDLPLFYKNKGY